MESQVADQEPELLNIQDVRFSYPGRPEPVLKGVDLRLERGETLLLTGPTGCGKSTLLKTLNGIVPLESSGHMHGVVRILGKDTRKCTLPELAQRVGLVFQSPEDQLFCTTVFDEVAFGPQNLGLKPAEVEARVSRALEQVGLGDQIGGCSERLSGGQKQRLAIACQLAMRPALLALDEPISQLDPKGAAEVLGVLAGLAREGMAVILVEHRLTEALKLASRVAIMDQGRLVMDCPSADLSRHATMLRALGLKVPDQVIYSEIQITSIKSKFGAAPATTSPPQRLAPVLPAESGTVLEFKEAGYTYPGSERPALSGLNLTLDRGDILAVMGSNGSGKSTLLAIMSGLLKPNAGELIADQGKSRFNGRGRKRTLGAMLFQNPDLLLIEPSLEQQLASPGRKDDSGKYARGLAQRLGLEAWLESPPWALSKGQRLRAALGSLLSLDPVLLLLDEPTTGQNQQNVRSLLEQILEQPGLASVVICSHDLETVWHFAHKVAVLEQGRLVQLGPVETILPDLAERPEFCPEPPLALRLSRMIGLDPPFMTMDAFLDLDDQREQA